MTHHFILDICICHAFYALHITIAIVTWLLVIVADVASIVAGTSPAPPPEAADLPYWTLFERWNLEVLCPSVHLNVCSNKVRPFKVRSS